MALKLDERYPGRANPPSLDYPQGSFKNRTSPDAKDGTYLEQDWANDQQGFFQSLIYKAGMVASGLVDKVGASQYYDALMRLINNPEHPSLSGDAIITGVDNKIVLENITPSLKLEKGDVIQIEGSGVQNEKLRTVESILGDGSIVVNYEHCGSRGNGSLKLEDFTGPVTITRIAKWFNAAEGLGQDWVNLTALRSIEVGYLSLSNREISVSSSGFATNSSGGGVILTIAGIGAIDTGSSMSTSIGLGVLGAIPRNSTYSVHGSNFAASSWMEKR